MSTGPMFLSSCDKQDTVIIDDEVITKESTSLKAGYCSGVFAAKTYAEIPIKSYRLATIYRGSYQHLKQPDKTSCSWTSYVIVAGTMINTNSCYPVTADKVYKVKAACSNSSMITALQTYANNYDKTYFSLARPSLGTSAFNAVKYMIGYIDTYHTPFLAISSMSGIGHYRIVHTIEWYGSITNSYVYFTDPAVVAYTNFDTNIRSMRLDQFLSSMLVACNNYNVLFFVPNWTVDYQNLGGGVYLISLFFLINLLIIFYK